MVSIMETMPSKGQAKLGKAKINDEVDTGSNNLRSSEAQSPFTKKKKQRRNHVKQKNQQRIPPRSNVIIYVHFRLYNEHPAQWLSIHVDDVHLCESKHYYHWAINHRARKKNSRRYFFAQHKS